MWSHTRPTQTTSFRAVWGPRNPEGRRSSRERTSKTAVRDTLSSCLLFSSATCALDSQSHVRTLATGSRISSAARWSRHRGGLARTPSSRAIAPVSPSHHLWEDLVKPIKAWCARCQQVVEWVEPRVVAAMTGKSRHTISNWMNRELVHTLVLPSRRRLVCLRSMNIRVAPPQNVEQKEKNGKSGRLTPAASRPRIHPIER